MLSSLEDMIADRIHNGQYRPGEPLREVALASSLGVSRTPVREALVRLELRGLADYVPNRGFRVATLNPKWASEYFPIIGSLESLAIRSSRRPDAVTIREMRALNVVLRDSWLAEGRAYETDARLHWLFYSRCDNEALLQMIVDTKRRIERYVRSMRYRLAHVNASCEQHEAIVDALDNRDKGRAADLVAAHWQAGVEWVGKTLETGANRKPE